MVVFCSIGEIGFPIAAGGLVGAAEPIECSRRRLRRGGPLQQLFEMRLGELAVFQPNKRIPAGVELRVGDGGGRGGNMRGCQIVGRLELAFLEKPAADDALLVPPFVGIDAIGRRCRQLLQKGCRAIEIVRLFLVQDIGEQQCAIALHGRFGRLEQLRRLGALLDHRAPGIEQRLHIAELGKAGGLFQAVAVKQIIHARLMVGGRQHVGKAVQHFPFQPGIKRIRGPEAGNDRLRPVGLANGLQSAGIKQAPLRRLRRAQAEGGENGVVARPLAIKRALIVAIEIGEAGPACKFFAR